MGKNSAHLARLSGECLLPVCVCLAIFPQAEFAQTSRSQSMSPAEAAIERFRKGARYQSPPTEFLSSGHIVEEELEPFGPALRREPAPVREEIVRLLADLGKRADPLYQQGGQLIREPYIVSLLVHEGLLRPDAGREASLTAMQECVQAKLLQPYGKVLDDDLEAHPGATAFLLIAKAKPGEAEGIVRTLREQPRWSKEPNARIAAAALGDTAIEKEYEAAFVSAADGEEKARQAHILGLIGTESALRTLARGLRSDLVIDKPQLYFKRSVRVDVLEALGYNFPEDTALYPSQIHDDSGYQRAEEFCEQRLGVRWTEPRPAFLTIAGYPIPPRND
jgi:hypothetical protein